MYFLPRAATAKDCAKRARNCEHIRVLVCLSVSLDYYFKWAGRPFSAKKVFPSVHALFANDVICWATT
jgi:hypothetical protein